MGTGNSPPVFYNNGIASGGRAILDFNKGQHQRLQIVGKNEISIINWPQAGFLGEMLLELVNGGGFPLTWPATINWIKQDGTFTNVFSENGINLQEDGIDFILLWTRSGGTVTYGKIIR